MLETSGHKGREAKGHGVLVVDDEPCIRRLLELVLGREGWVVCSVASGREAIELYRSKQGHIDLVLLDLMMPEMDGLQTLAELQRLNPSVRTLFVTGYADKEVCEALRKAGAIAVVSKPFELAAIVELVGAELAGLDRISAGVEVEQTVGLGGDVCVED